MTLVARDHSYQAAIDRVYDAVSRVRFEGMQFRRDIGRQSAHETGGNSALSASSRCPRKSQSVPLGTST